MYVCTVPGKYDRHADIQVGGAADSSKLFQETNDISLPPPPPLLPSFLHSLLRSQWITLLPLINTK